MPKRATTRSEVALTKVGQKGPLSKGVLLEEGTPEVSHEEQVSTIGGSTKRHASLLADCRMI